MLSTYWNSIHDWRLQHRTHNLPVIWLSIGQQWSPSKITSIFRYAFVHITCRLFLICEFRRDLVVDVSLISFSLPLLSTRRTSLTTTKLSKILLDLSTRSGILTLLFLPNCKFHQQRLLPAIDPTHFMGIWTMVLVLSRPWTSVCLSGTVIDIYPPQHPFVVVRSSSPPPKPSVVLSRLRA